MAENVPVVVNVQVEAMDRPSTCPSCGSASFLVSTEEVTSGTMTTLRCQTTGCCFFWAGVTPPPDALSRTA